MIDFLIKTYPVPIWFIIIAVILMFAGAVLTLFSLVAFGFFGGKLPFIEKIEKSRKKKVIKFYINNRLVLTKPYSRRQYRKMLKQINDTQYSKIVIVKETKKEENGRGFIKNEKS